MNCLEVHAHRPTERGFKDLLSKDLERAWVLDTETNGLDVVGHEAPHKAFWIGLMPMGSPHVFILTREEFDDWGIKELLEHRRLIGHNLRFDLHALGLNPKRAWVDTMLASYYRHTTGRHSMDHIASVKGWHKIATPDLLKRGLIHDIPDQELIRYLADDCLITARMAKTLQVERAVEDYETERAVYQMERRGMRLLPEKMRIVSVKLDKLIVAGEKPLREAGMAGNLNSATQVGEWLIANGRRLPYTTGGRPSTTKIVLQKLADEGDPLAQILIDWRKLIKLRTSFIGPLPKLAQGDILYPRTSTTRTATGRFACNSPNLQQIPKRGPLGKDIRSCLTSKDRTGVTACDFSQVELRVAASFAEEPVLLEAFATNRCPHTEVAAKMLGKLPEAITPDERFRAKAVNFGILNGMGAKRLALELKSDKTVAKRFLSEYKRNLPALHTWMEKVWQEADTYRIARTVSGRTRIFSSFEKTRPAISVMVQGSAAELMRHALVAVENAGLNPILSVHDEILIGGTGRGEELREIMVDAANGAYSDTFNNVQFPASAQSGETWGDV
jgi:DNA polymerase I-like protein with 3'-5' exonuclease and polymerase domains